MGSDCVFCRIIAGEIPAKIVFSTDAAVAFLDVAPLSAGHTLVVPRQHERLITDLSPDALAGTTALLPTVARAIQRVTGAAGLNILQNNGRVSGQVVEHVHFHLIPRTENDGLGYRWNAGTYPPGRAEELHGALRRELSA